MNEFKFDIDALHCVQLSILKEFDRVCHDNNLRYFLAFGTLLGAIRHGGFIPWDDDIDVFMPYSEYVKLQKLPKSVWAKPYFLQSDYSDLQYNKCYMKLRNSDTTLIVDDVVDKDINHGVDIDIYPVVNLSDDYKQRERQYYKTMLYMLLQVNSPPNNHGRFFFYGGKLVLSLIPNFIKKKLKKKLLEEITAYETIRTENSYVICGNIEIMKQLLCNKWFEDCEYHTFEDKLFPIPSGAHDWLRNRYGEQYMELPPKEMRGIKLEHFIMVDLDNSYTKYKGLYYCKNKKY